MMITATLVFLAFCFGFIVAGLMAEAKRNDETTKREDKRHE